MSESCPSSTSKTYYGNSKTIFTENFVKKNRNSETLILLNQINLLASTVYQQKQQTSQNFKWRDKCICQ